MDNLIDKKQVAEILKVSVKTIDLWLAKGIGPKPIRLGRLVRYKMSEVQGFIDKLQAED